MADWTKTFIRPDASIRDVLACIDAGELRIALVVDPETRLLGVITDGDVRRALLSGFTLDAKATDIMTRRPVTATPDMKLAAIEQLMLKHSLQQVPVIDERGVIVSLALYGTLLPRERLENEVFLMVGGLGSRLGDLTRHIPKPLLRLGDKPILEIIIDSLLSQGFNRFTFAVNYKAELIERHFGNGSRWGAEIRYLRESKRLGTCGALGLVEELPTRPFVVMNGDILTKVQFRHMLDFHTDHAAAATMAVREFSFQVPFGVTRVEGDKVREISEKPVERYLVNAGIYVLSPAALPLIPSGDYFDMTTLLTRLLDARMPVHSYVVDDYWLDIGRIDDLQKAHADFETNWLQQDAPR